MESRGLSSPRDSIHLLAAQALPDCGEEVVEGPVGACGVAGGVEVLEQATDDGEYESRKLRPAETAHAVLEWGEPVGGGGTPEPGPERFTRGVVQSVEHA